MRTVLKTLGALLLMGIVILAIAAYRIYQPPLPVVKADVIKVAAVGDSNTYGAGVLMDNRSQNAFPAQLEALLGEGYQVLNYGLSARTLLSTGDTPYTAEAFYQHSQTANPDIVLVMLGTNDSKPHNWNAAAYERELAEFVAVYKKLPNKPQVFLLTVPAAYDNVMDVDQTVIESEVVPIIKRVGARTDTPVIDVFSVTKDHSEYFPDGVHPNAIGLKLVAEKVHAGIIEQAHQYGR